MNVPPARRVRVRVPASTSNLGPGFDVMGMALQIYNTLTVERTDGGVEITASGEAAEELCMVEESVVVRAINTACRAWGEEIPGLRIHLENQVPLARGLGGSSTAVIGGILAAAALSGRSLSLEEILTLALPLEGHPDNITPSLVGGLTISLVEEGQVHFLQVPVPPELQAVVCVPDMRLSTQLARDVLPKEVPLQDAIYNMHALAFLVSGLFMKRPEVMAMGMKDRLHQPYRVPLLPAMEPIFQAALEAGAVGAALSGAGSTIFAFALDNAPDVAQAMQGALEASGLSGRTVVTEIETEGAQIVEVE